MKKGNTFLTGLIVFVTVALGGVAVFTAVRLYQLRNEPVALNVPKNNAYAFSCGDYDMAIDTNGIVRIINNTDSTQPSKTIDLIVNGQSIGSFTVPQLDPDTNYALGNINLPEGDFNWSIGGDILCQGDNNGTIHETSLCSAFNFTVNAQEISITPTVPAQSTATPTNIPSKTPTPTQTQSSNPTATPTNQPAATSTPTPTTYITTQTELPTSQQLPDSGISTPTILTMVLGFLTILAAIFLAII